MLMDQHRGAVQRGSVVRSGGCKPPLPALLLVVYRLRPLCLHGPVIKWFFIY